MLIGIKEKDFHTIPSEVKQELKPFPDSYLQGYNFYLTKLEEIKTVEASLAEKKKLKDKANQLHLDDPERKEELLATYGKIPDEILALTDKLSDLEVELGKYEYYYLLCKATLSFNEAIPKKLETIKSSMLEKHKFLWYRINLDFKEAGVTYNCEGSYKYVVTRNYPVSPLTTKLIQAGISYVIIPEREVTYDFIGDNEKKALSRIKPVKFGNQGFPNYTIFEDRNLGYLTINGKDITKKGKDELTFTQAEQMFFDKIKEANKTKNVANLSYGFFEDEYRYNPYPVTDALADANNYIAAALLNEAIEKLCKLDSAFEKANFVVDPYYYIKKEKFGEIIPNSCYIKYSMGKHGLGDVFKEPTYKERPWVDQFIEGIKAIFAVRNLKPTNSDEYNYHLWEMPGIQYTVVVKRQRGEVTT